MIIYDIKNRVAKHWREKKESDGTAGGCSGCACCREDARASVLVPQHVRGGRGERRAVALQVLRQGGVQPLAPLPLAHGAALALPLLPRHLQPHRHAALAPAPQARGAAAQALGRTDAPDPADHRRDRPDPRVAIFFSWHGLKPCQA